MNKSNQDSLEGQREWLEQFYKEIYLQVGFGPRQNAYYMEELIQHLHPRVISYINSATVSILDSGCAMGYGTIKLKEAFPTASIFGMDVCETAVTGAISKFPQIDFFFNHQGMIEDPFDVIISSHCLEHYADPVDILIDMLKMARKYCIVMVPYNENPPINKHLCTITENTFPDQIILGSSEFQKISTVIFPGDRQYCRNDNIQFVFENKSASLQEL